MTLLDRIELELYLAERREQHDLKKQQFQHALAIARGDWKPRTKN
jgi:hypothetical protein